MRKFHLVVEILLAVAPRTPVVLMHRERRYHAYSRQQTRDPEPILVQCWAYIYEDLALVGLVVKGITSNTCWCFSIPTPR